MAFCPSSLPPPAPPLPSPRAPPCRRRRCLSHPLLPLRWPMPLPLTTATTMVTMMRLSAASLLRWALGRRLWRFCWLLLPRRVLAPQRPAPSHHRSSFTTPASSAPRQQPLTVPLRRTEAETEGNRQRRGNGGPLSQPPPPPLRTAFPSSSRQPRS